MDQLGICMYIIMQLSNEKAMILHNLKQLIKEDKARTKIAEKSDSQFSAEDIHIEVNLAIIII